MRKGRRRWRGKLERTCDLNQLIAEHEARLQLRIGHEQFDHEYSSNAGDT